MSAKTRQLQIRVTASQKASIRRLARGAGQSVSAYVLSRVLPAEGSRFAEILFALRRDEDQRFALAELHELLAGLGPEQYADALHEADLGGLPPLLQNTVAAMIEEAGRRIGVVAPTWTRQVEPLETPHFAVPFPSLRPYLLRVSPVAFKRRNLFVDATVGDRV
jgi:hypothetical protein